MRCRGCTCLRCRRCTCWLTRMSIPLSLLLDTSWSTEVSGMRYQIRVRLSEEHQRRLDEPSGLLGTFAFRLRFYSCIAEVYGGPRALVLRASTCCAGPLVAPPSSGVFAAIRPRVHFLKRPARKAFVRLRHARLLVCLSNAIIAVHSAFPAKSVSALPPLPVPTRILTSG